MTWCLYAYLIIGLLNAVFIYACARRVKNYPRWKIVVFAVLYGACWLPLNVVLNVGALLWLSEGWEL